MSNRAAIFREEHSGKSVTHRGKNFIEFDLGSNQRRYIATIEPLHYGISHDQEIDTTWVADTGAWQWKLVENDHQIHARDVFNVGSLAEWRIGNSWCILDPQSINWINQDTSREQIAIKQAVTGVPNDCEMTYTNAYGSGRHFKYLVHPKRLIKHITIDSLSSLPTPNIAGTIWFEAEFTIATSSNVDFWLDGVKWNKASGVRVQTVNRIECRDNSNGDALLWYLDKPTATDANGNSISTQYEVRRDGGPSSLFITVRVPREWLLSAVYPVVIDPTYTDGYGGDVTTYFDTWIQQAYPTDAMGGETYLSWNGQPSYLEKPILKFNVSALSGYTINSATMSLWGAQDFYWQATTVYFYDILSGNASMTEGGACWSYRTGTTAWAGSAGCSTAGTDYNATAIGSRAFTGNESSTNIEKQWSLSTTAIASWASGNNYGIMSNSGQFYWMVHSSDVTTTGYRPKLVVDYTAGGDYEASKSDTITVSESFGILDILNVSNQR